MVTNIWAKYLPVLRIVLKRSLAGEQQLALNVPDFEKAGYKRKTGQKFLVGLKNGRLTNVLVDTPIASSLASTLLDDAVVKELTNGNEFHISMNTKFQLTIKHILHQEVE